MTIFKEFVSIIVMTEQIKIMIRTALRKTLFILSFLLFASNVNAQRKVLVEQFTNSGCPTCAGITPLVASFVNANPGSYLMLAYHAPYPYNDSMYFENAAQTDQRIIFSNVAGVPTSRVDGSFFSGNLVPNMSTTLMNASAVAPRYNISFSSSERNGNELNVSVLFESLDMNNTGEDLVAMVVVAEKNVLKSSYVCCPGTNIENEYPWVVRRMLPDADGTMLVNKGLGGIDLVNLSWTANNFKDLNEMRVIAFVQNLNTKSVYQSELSSPVNTTGIFDHGNMDNNLFSILSPMSNKLINLKINDPSSTYKIRIFDVLGNVVLNSNTNYSSLVSIDANRFQEGMYFVELSTNSSIQTRKVILAN